MSIWEQQHSSRRSKNSFRSGKFKRNHAWLFNLRRNIRRKLKALRRRYSPKLLLYPLAVIFLFFLCWFVFFSSFLDIKQIELELVPHAEDLREEALQQELNKKVLGSNLLFFTKKDLDFLKQDLSIAEVDVSRLGFNTVEVTLTKRIPVAMVSDAQERLFLVDREGKIFLRSKLDNFPVLIVQRDLDLGEEISQEGMDFFLAISDDVDRLGMKVEFCEINSSLRLKLADGPIILSPPNLDKVEKIIAVLENYNARGEVLKKVDLRAENPVVEIE
ncbi:MAG: cell division protein FtsQ/DivIB [Patescibacteria group bacterium]